MESSACRRRASDAEQSAWAYSMTAEREPVKEEPEWGEGECGVSEAAAAEGLYADHEVKDELVFGPELLQQQDIAFSMQSAMYRKDEDPCKQKPGGGAEPAPERPRRGEAPRCVMSHKQQFKLRSCFVKLKHILMEDLPTCKTCLMTFDCKSSLRNHSCTHSVEESNFYKEVCDESATTYFKCDICGKQYAQKRHLEKHLATHDVKTVSEKRLQHLPGDARFVNKELSYSDTVTKSEYRNLSASASHTGEKPSLYRCNVCSKMFTQKQDFSRHVATCLNIHSAIKKPKLYKCDICNKCFARQANLTIHKRVHTGEKPYTCDICNKRFKSSKGFNLHKLNHTGVKAFACDICSKRFITKSILTNHIKSHTGQKLYSCAKCTKRYTQRGNLNKHMRSHTGQKLYSCAKCTERYTQRVHLNKHMKIHTGEKLHSCAKCRKRFTRKDHLTRHMRIHSDKKFYSCSVCNRQYTKQETLNNHMILHSEKLFKCDTCKKDFTLKCNLIKHIRIHTGEKPNSCSVRNKTGEKLYSCDKCNKRFTHKSYLTQHNMRIHENSCIVCNRRFPHRLSLINHMNLMHTVKTMYSGNGNIIYIVQY